MRKLLFLATFCVALQASEFQSIAMRFRVAANRFAPLASLDASGELIPVRILRSIKIEFGEVDSADPNKAAQCQLSDQEEPVVTVARAFWERTNQWDHEVIIFHELGHCILKRDHDSRTRADGTPRSIMHPHCLGGEAYLLNRDYYLQELFQTFYETPHSLLGTKLKP